MSTQSPFTLSFQERLAIIQIDEVEEPVNTLKAEFAEELSQQLHQIEKHPEAKGVVLISAKPDCFVAGADISMLDSCETAAQGEALARKGHQIFAQIESFPLPIVAAIHGTCLGGGLELALACHGRVVTDSEKTRLGLPEVQLGLLPGGGGTQRLPRLIGPMKALDMMLTGKQLRAKQALKSGLADDLVPESILLQAAEKLALSGKPKHKKFKRPLMTQFLESAAGRSILFSQARKKLLAKSRGNYPAAERILELVEYGLKMGREEGLQQEAKYFGELVVSGVSKQLRQIFFATTAMKKEFAEEATPVEKVLVLGGGLMGGGIANVSAIRAGIPTRIKDISNEGISHALKYTYDLLTKRVKRRIITPVQRAKQMNLLSASLDYSGSRDADLVIEAVFEELSLKQQMVADVEAHCAAQTIFASNTSSLPIHQIAEQAQRPEQVIGLHYFSPVDKMPLVEVIPHTGTSEKTIAQTVAFARKQGKTPIVVKDEAGFYVNRILAPYINQAASLVLAGEPIEKIDQALVDYGFPIGPMALLDEVGIDVGAKIAPILEQNLGSRFAAPSAFDSLLADGRKGKKNGKGFYLYSKKLWQRHKQVDPSVYQMLGVSPGGIGHLPVKQLCDLCVLPMLNEAARCLEEGIIRSARDGDIGAIFGIGFPPFRGGPFRLMDEIGIPALVKRLQGFAIDYGEPFEPCELLVNMASKEQLFYD